MKKYGKNIDYVLIIVIVLSVVILAAGIFGIDYFLNRPGNLDGEDENVTPTEPVFVDEINLLDEEGDFRKYYISIQDSSYSANVLDVNIDINEDSIIIDGIEAISGAYPTKYLSFYGDIMILPYIYSDYWYGGLISYNIKDQTIDVIDHIGKQYILNTMDAFTSSSEGIMLNSSIVNGNDIYVEDGIKDVCSVKKSKKTKVQKNVFVKYDQKKKKFDFDDFDEISSISLESYKTVNELC